MNHPSPERDDDGRGTEPEEDDPPLTEAGAEAGPGGEAGPGEPETGHRKYRPL